MLPKYLKPNIMFEPLVDRWYAWSHLIPPATAARNITHRHLSIMESYVNAPRAHQAAVKDPRLQGGPFIDYPEDRADAVRSLREQTLQRRSQMIELSQALADVDCLLRTRSTGCSLEGLYEDVPLILRGFVELIYDLNHHASFRLIETLIYRSRFYDPSAQTIMLSPISQDDRPFVLSTPRLDREGSLHLKLPFSHPAIDTLARMTRSPARLSDVVESLCLDREEQTVFQGFVDEEPPPPYGRYTQAGVRWRYFGHACILLETASAAILVDPVLSYTYESAVSRYTYLDLPEFIDFVLITHNHQDHILFETLLQIRHKVGTIVVPRNGGGALQDPSLKLMLEQCGFKNVIELGEMQQLEFEDGALMGIPFFGEHGDLAIHTKLAYLVRLGNRSLLLAADSNNISPDTYRLVHQWVGDIDTLFLGMECDGAPMSWLYGPLFSDKVDRQMDRSRRLAGSDCRKALGVVEAMRCREVYIYAMGQEPWLNHVMSLKYTAQSNPIVESDRLIASCRERGIVAERLFGEKEILLSRN
jgi:L-ascorbate metabolism protein UlaG (beta-lactamase superfamily)